MTTPIVGLTPEFASKELTVGDLVQVQILFSDKMEAGPADWEFLPYDGSTWIVANGVAFDPKNVLASDPSDALTKITIPAIVLKPGKLVFSDVTLKYKKSGQEFPLNGSLNDQSKQFVEAKEDPFFWQYPFLEYGACRDWLWISGLLLFVLLTIAYLVWKRNRDKRFGRTKNPFEKAHDSLKELEKYKNLPGTQENWKKFSFSLAGTIRLFLDHRFNTHSADLTDREFYEKLRGFAEGGPGAAEASSKILRELEEVRYGQANLSPQTYDNVLSKSQILLAESIAYVEKLKAVAAEKKK